MRDAPISLAVGVPRREEADFWGDYHFARSLQHELRAAGHPTSMELLPAWDRAVGARSDVRLHLFGLSELSPRLGQVNLLWVISHPELVGPSLIEAYDAAFVASQASPSDSPSAAENPSGRSCRLRTRGASIPTPPGPMHSLLFVGNSCKVRRIVDDVTALGYRIAVYGREWTQDLIDPDLVRGESIDNRELRRFYSSAQIVLNDHWDDMRASWLSLEPALRCPRMRRLRRLRPPRRDRRRVRRDGRTHKDRDQLAGRLERLRDDDNMRRSLEPRAVRWCSLATPSRTG